MVVRSSGIARDPSHESRVGGEDLDGKGLWMRLVSALTWVVVAAAAAVPANPASPGPPEGHRQAASGARPGVVVAVPELVSVDDLAPARSTDSTGATALGSPGPDLRTRPTQLTHPPGKGADGSAPPAGTPQAALAAAYRRAVARAPAGCRLQAAHLAAIGQVESGSIGGRSVTADHRVTPAIYGPLLDGGPFALVHDSDGGRYDGASDFDRAMGPLQFLPGTWSWAGRDGDGDGRRDPQNLYDAALATADYLCDGGRDLSRPGDLRAAVLAYNQSSAYLSAVLEWVSYFQRHGLAAMATVAFRVGSGGRASAMQAPLPDPTPPSTSPVTPATPRRTASAPSTAATSQDPTAGATGTPSPVSTSSPSTGPTSPSSDPTTAGSDPANQTPTASSTTTTPPEPTTTPTPTTTTTATATSPPTDPSP